MSAAGTKSDSWVTDANTECAADEEDDEAFDDCVECARHRTTGILGFACNHFDCVSLLRATLMRSHLLEIYSGPATQKPATFTALIKDIRPVEASGATHGPGSTQWRKPKQLIALSVSTAVFRPGMGGSLSVLIQRISTQHRHKRKHNEPGGQDDFAQGKPD